MKKVLNAIVWTLLCAMMLGLFPAYAQEDITVMVDGKAVAFTDQKPVMVEDRVLVPLRGVFNALGAVVEYIEETESVFASKRSSYITLEIGSNELYVNGTAVTLDVPSQLIQDRTMVPLAQWQRHLVRTLHGMTAPTPCISPASRACTTLQTVIWTRNTRRRTAQYC